MERVTINPSIAATVSIDPVGHKEIVPIYFKASENIEGTFVFSLWNSEKKTSEQSFTGDPINVLEDLLTLTIDPVTMAVPVGLYYYEITKTEDKRVYFKGSLNIVN